MFPRTLDMKFRILPVLVCLFAGSAFAKKTTLGVFLPTTMADGQARFDLSEKLGPALSTALGTDVVARNFGKYEDFEKAMKSGSIDIALVDGWAAAQLGQGTPVGLAEVQGQSAQTWAIVSYAKGVVKDLSGKRLAVPRGARSLDAKFVTNVMFQGDFDARRNFRIVGVPNVESGLRALQSKGAEAALVPSMHVPDDARVLFTSAPLPGVVMLSVHGDAAALGQAIPKIAAVAPLEKFDAAPADALGDLRQLLNKGPPKRVPVIAESPVLRPDTSPVVSFRDVGLVLPSFVDLIDSPKEHPDD
jgi:hypothetical protein